MFPMSERFIDRPTSVLLDLIRFVCAFLVLLCHVSGGLPIYTGPAPLSGRVSHYCVIVFFVLSGAVIAASTSERRKDLRSYASARFARIISVALPTVLFCGLLQIAVTVWAGQMAAASLSGLARSMLVDLTFMSQSGLGPGTPNNGTYWSLCYEVWYYALFGVALFLEGRRRWAVLAVLTVLAGWRILLLMPVWLAGVWLVQAKPWRALTFTQGLIVLPVCLIALAWVTTWDIPVMLALRRVSPVALGMSELVVSDFFVAAITVAAIAALRPIAQRNSALLERLSKPIQYAAGFSFTLYLFHFPIVSTLTLLGVRAGDSIWGLGAVLCTVLALTAGIAELTERRAPALRAFLEKLTLPHFRTQQVEVA